MDNEIPESLHLPDEVSKIKVTVKKNLDTLIERSQNPNFPTGETSDVYIDTMNHCVTLQEIAQNKSDYLVEIPADISSDLGLMSFNVFWGG